MSSGSGTNPGDITASSSNSRNAAQNTRAYIASKHNEFNKPVFEAPTTFVNTTNNYLFGGGGEPTQTGEGGEPTQTREVLEDLVATKVDWSTLSRHLSFVDQDSHRSTNVPLDQNAPEFPWITKDMDFMKWESDEKSQALWLSGPRDGMKGVASQVIAKEKAIRSSGCVLYFFCATARGEESSIATIFAHTLLCQIVSVSGAGDQAITTAFLASLLDGHIQRSLSGFKKDDALDTTVKKILDVRDKDLHIPLAKAIAIAKLEDLSLIIDGISIAESKDDAFVQNVSFLVDHMMDARTTRFKALLTSRQHSELRELLGHLPSIELGKERKECLRSLQDHDGTRYAKITREHGGSLEWLWQNAEYSNWTQSTTSNLLYVEGKPGSGKSTLAKYFERNLAQRVPDSKSSTVTSYFYTIRGTILEATHKNMLRSILHSILTQDESVFYHFQPEFRRFRQYSEWPYESLKHILYSLADHVSSKPLYLILDAMDESMEEDRMEVVELLCKLCSAKGFRVKALIASRPAASLNLLFTKWRKVMHVIRLQDENSSDICKFTDDFLAELYLSVSILREIGDYIKDNAEGVFVWVQMVKTELSRLRATGLNDVQLRDHLKRLPRELEEFYKIMLDRLEGGDRDEIQDGITLFQFVLFSSRPLTVAELQQVLAIRASERDPSATPPHDKFRHHLSNAVEARITHCGGNFLEITADKTVQLMHQTAREFLLRITQRTHGSRFDLSSQRAHGVIATTSIQYLMLCLGSPDNSVKDTLSAITSWGSDEFRGYATYLSQWPWINYAIRNLHYHQQSCDRRKQVLHLVDELAKRLTGISGTAFLGKWMANRHRKDKSLSSFIRESASWVFPRYNPPDSTRDFNCRLLDAAAVLDLPQVFELVHLASLSVPGEVLLISTATKGLAAASRELINRGDNIDAVDAAGRSALHHAAENCDVSMIRLLAERGAAWDIRDNHWIAPIDVAGKASGIDGIVRTVFVRCRNGDGFDRFDGVVVNVGVDHRIDRNRAFSFHGSHFHGNLTHDVGVGVVDDLFRNFCFFVDCEFHGRVFVNNVNNVNSVYFRRDELPPMIHIMLYGDTYTIEPTQDVGN